MPQFNFKAHVGAIGLVATLGLAGCMENNSTPKVSSRTRAATSTTTSALTLSPTTRNVLVNSTSTFTATGGTPSYTYAVVGGGAGGTISSGVFTAPAAAGVTTLRVTDTRTSTATAVVTIAAALTMTPATGTMAVANAWEMTIAGGFTPYTYTVISGTGTFAAGTYTSNSTATGTSTVRVTDAEGNTATSIFTVVPALSISPTVATIDVTDNRTFTATNGVPTYSFSVTGSGGGSVGAGSGVYTPSGAGTDTITVSDTHTNTATAVVVVTTPPRGIAASQNQSCAIGITTAGMLECWGHRQSGALGTGANANSYQTQPGQTTSRVYQEKKFIYVSEGRNYGCAIDDESKLYCWGENNYGQAGLNNTTDYSAPQAVDSSVSYSTVSAGASTTCAITTAGALKCWGYNGYGQLGNGAANNNQHYTPGIVNSGTTYRAVSVGLRHTCAITAATATPANRLRCWGNNAFGQLGDSTTTSHYSPASGADVLDAVQFASVDVGAMHSCAISVAGTLYCWGYNRRGQLGVGAGDTTDRSSPVSVSGGATYSSVSAGNSYDNSGNDHTCAITTAGVAQCWGYNSNGQTGDGDATHTSKTVPTAVDDVLNYSQIAAGAYHSCGITTTNVYKCWGLGTSYQIGDGTNVSKDSPEVAP